MNIFSLIAFGCSISLAWVSRSEAQTPPRTSSSSPTKALPAKSAPVKKSSGFKCAPSDPTASGEDFPSNLQELVEDKTVTTQNRLNVLACIATHEHDRRVQREQDMRLAIIQLAAAQDKINDDVKYLHHAIFVLKEGQTAALAQAPVVGLTPENDVGMMKLELDKVKNTVTQLCSAIRTSLVMNGTSATPSGGALWSACSN